MEDLPWENNNMEPLKVVQYKYEQEEFNTLVKEAFNRLTEGNTVTVVTNDKTVRVPSGGLMVFSPMLRSAVSSLNQQQEVVIMIPESSSSSFLHLVNILSDGDTEIQVDDVNTTELLVIANCLGIDLTNFEYVASVKKAKIQMESVTAEGLNTTENGAKVAKNKRGNAVDGKSKKGKTTARNANTGKENKHSNKSAMEEVSEKDNKDNIGKVTTGTLKEQPNPSNGHSSEDTFNEDEYSDDDFYDEYEAEDEKQFQKNLENSLNTSKDEDMKSNSVVEKMESSTTIQQAPPPPLNTNQFNNPPQPKQGGLWAMSTNRQQNQTSALTNPAPAPLPRAPLPAPTSQPNQFPAHKPTQANPALQRGQPNPANLQALVNRYASRVGNKIGSPQPSPIQFSPSQTSNFAQQSSSVVATSHGSPKTPSRPLNSSFTLPVQTGSPKINPYKTTQGPPNSLLSPVNYPQGISATPAPINPLPAPHAQNPPYNQLDQVSSPQTAAAGLPCQLCPKLSSGVGLLWQHYAARHFLTDLRAHTLPSDLASKSCSACGSQFKSVQNLLIHVGTVHHKVEDVMMAKGLQPIKKKRGQGMGQGGA